MGLAALNRLRNWLPKVNNQSLLYLLQTLGVTRIVEANEINDLKDAIIYLADNLNLKFTETTYMGGSQIFTFDFTEIKQISVNGVVLKNNEVIISGQTIDFQNKLEINDFIKYIYV